MRALPRLIAVAERSVKGRAPIDITS